MCIEIIKTIGIPSLLGVVVGWGLSSITDSIKRKREAKKLFQALIIEIKQNQKRLKGEAALESFDAFYLKNKVKPGIHYDPEYKKAIYESALSRLSVLTSKKVEQIFSYYETIKMATHKISIYNTIINQPDDFKKEFFDQYCKNVKQAFDIGKVIVQLKG